MIIIEEIKLGDILKDKKTGNEYKIFGYDQSKSVILICSRIKYSNDLINQCWWNTSEFDFNYLSLHNERMIFDSELNEYPYGCWHYNLKNYKNNYEIISNSSPIKLLKFKEEPPYKTIFAKDIKQNDIIFYYGEDKASSLKQIIVEETEEDENDDRPFISIIGKIFKNNLLQRSKKLPLSIDEKVLLIKRDL